eukprot:1196791-Rhodomonas_salina.2
MILLIGKTQATLETSITDTRNSVGPTLGCSDGSKDPSNSTVGSVLWYRFLSLFAPAYSSPASLSTLEVPLPRALWSLLPVPRCACSATL